MATEATREWRWWRKEAGSRAKALEEFQSLPVDVQASLDVLMDRHRRNQSRLKDVDHLGDGIYELRYRRGNNHYRLLFCKWGPHLVALTVFYKNQRATPRRDVERAQDRRTAWYDEFGEQPDT